MRRQHRDQKGGGLDAARGRSRVCADKHRQHHDERGFIGQRAAHDLDGNNRSDKQGTERFRALKRYLANHPSQE